LIPLTVRELPAAPLDALREKLWLGTVCFAVLARELPSVADTVFAP